MPPSRSRVSVKQSPSPRLACLAIASGIRIAKLFPHFEIVDSFRICIYFEYKCDFHAIGLGDKETDPLFLPAGAATNYGAGQKPGRRAGRPAPQDMRSDSLRQGY
jgi:hypothetical protein